VTRSTANLELSFLFEGHGEVLQEIGIEGMSRGPRFPNEGCALSREDRDRVWCALPEWLQERLMADAETLYEPEQDDWHAEDARISKEVA
jgi:hypothetical protein